MGVIGLGWGDLSTHWSNNRKAFTPEDLDWNIKTIVSKQRQCYIPTKPPMLLLEQKALLKLVTQETDIVAMDADHLETSG